MTRRRIYLVRHAEVEYFSDPNFSHDPVLTETGRLQASTIGKLLQQLNASFDIVVSSSHLRTQQTASIICETLGTKNPIEVYDELREIQIGKDQEITAEEVENCFFLTEKVVSVSSRFLRGESIEEFLLRVNKVFDRIRQRKSWNNVLIVAHGGVNTAILSRAISGKSNTYFTSIEQDYACLNIIDVGEEQEDQIVRLMNYFPNKVEPRERTTTIERFVQVFLKNKLPAESSSD